jgi:hypothetical protein
MKILMISIIPSFFFLKRIQGQISAIWCKKEKQNKKTDLRIFKNKIDPEIH